LSPNADRHLLALVSRDADTSVANCSGERHNERLAVGSSVDESTFVGNGEGTSALRMSPDQCVEALVTPTTSPPIRPAVRVSLVVSHARIMAWLTDDM